MIIGAALCSVIAVMFGGLCDMLGSSVGRWMLTNAVYLAIPPAVVFVVGAVLDSRVKSAIMRMDYMCCMRCCYNLSATDRLSSDPGAVRCPECGELWGVEQLQDKWKQHFMLKLPHKFEE